jgi:hypothetical protein
MKKFWIDFSGYITVKAENANKAECKFWDVIHNKCPFLDGDGFSDDVWDIIDITEEDCDVSTIDNLNKPTLQDIEDFWNDK